MFIFEAYDWLEETSAFEKFVIKFENTEKVKNFLINFEDGKIFNDFDKEGKNMKLVRDSKMPKLKVKQLIRVKKKIRGNIRRKSRRWQKLKNK